MADSDTIGKAVKTIIAINAAIRNLRLYPASSASSSNSIDKAFQMIQDILEADGTITFRETERSLVINDQPLDEKEQKKPQVSAFLDILLNFGVKAMTFNKKLTRDEVAEMLEFMSMKTDELRASGGVQEAFEAKTLENVKLTFLGVGAGGDDTLDEKGAIAKEAFVPMIQTLDELLDDEEKARISKKLAAAIAGREDDILISLMSQHLEGDFGRGLVHETIALIDDEKFERLLSGVREIMDDAVSRKGSLQPAEIASVKAAYQTMLGSEKGEKLKARIKEKEEREKAEKARQASHVKAGLNAIVKGETAPLKDHVVMEAVPGMTEQFLARDKVKTAEAIIGRLGAGLSTDDPAIQTEVSQALAAIGEKLAERAQWEILQAVSGPLAGWVGRQRRADAAFGPVCTQLATLGGRLLAEENDAAAAPIFDGLNQAYAGSYDLNAEVTEIAGNALGEMASAEVLDPLMQEFQTNADGGRDQAVKKMIRMGAPAAERLIALLKTSEDRSERSRILQVIPEFRDRALPALLQGVEQGEPWYFMRNLALLLGKNGDETHLEVLKPFLQHSDIRVQREALNSIYALGKDYLDCEEALLEALPAADDAFKIDIIGALSGLECADAVPALIDMLESRELAASKLRNELAEKICQALGSLGAHEAIPALSGILERKKKGLLGKAFDDRVKAAASRAIEMAGKGKQAAPKKKRRIRKRRPQAAEDGGQTAAERKKLQDALAEKEAGLEDLVLKGDQDGAVGLLLELIAGHAQVRDFRKAEALRDRIEDINEMALIEITKANEIIDQAKAGAVDREHMERFSGLYGGLTDEESSALFFALKPENQGEDAIVFRQGDVSDRLYLIDDGELALCFGAGDAVTDIKTLQAGDVAGEESFFGVSVCTASLKTVSDSMLYILEKSALTAWKDSLPALGSKLKAYCLKLEKIPDVLKKNGLDRRRHVRRDMTAKAAVQALDAAGKPTGAPMKGDVSDISQGGLSFITKVREDVIEKMLNRPCRMAFNLKIGDAVHKTEKTGRIVAVNYHFDNAFNFHIAFDKRFSDKVMKKL